ncbi:MAG: Holliday junction branch migration protein RuvA [Lachnospiraceae bacterium]|nr:Holliday junction branch migration protein RuvA [Lachnospiraceae bacterium]
MISYIKGELVEIGKENIVVENNGIGYNIFIPQSVLVNVGPIGSEVKIHTYFYVKEDAMQLYGFTTTEELRVFKLLITVNGIGPKGALSIMSTLSVDKIKLAIITDDSKAIAKSPGVGAKTAQRVIIDLKDKFKDDDIVTSSDDDIVVVEKNENVNEAVAALVSLGYTQSEAKKALKDVSMDLAVDEMLKFALKNLL